MRIGFWDPIAWDYTVESVYQKPLGGSQSALCYLGEILAKQGHEVFLFNQTSTPGHYRGVTCIQQPVSAKQLQSLALDALIIINSERFGVQLKPFVGENTRLVLWTQQTPEVPTMKGLHNPRSRDVYDGIVFVSDWQRDRYLEYFELDKTRTCVLRNAIAPAFCNLFPPGTPILAQKTQPPVLAYTSTPYRGLHNLLKIFPRIRQAVPGTTLKVFSSLKVYQYDSAKDESIFGELYRICRETEGVEYIGSIPQPELARELQRVSVLTYPNSYAETSCIAVMEAMASGCPVVTCHLGALPETTAGFARLIPVIDNYEAYKERFVEATVQVLRDCTSTDAETQVRRQVDYINSSCTWQIRAEQWVQWLSSICGNFANVAQNLTPQPPSLLGKEEQLSPPRCGEGSGEGLILVQNVNKMDFNVAQQSHSLPIYAGWKKMRIAFLDLSGWNYLVESAYQMPLGGSQSALCYLAEALVKQGHEVFLINSTSTPGMSRGVVCLPLPLNNLSEELLRSLDVLIVLNLAVKEIQIRPLVGEKTRLVLWTGQLHTLEVMSELENPAERDIYDGIVFVSDWQRDQYVRHFGIDKSRTTVLRNAIAPAFCNLFPDGTPILAHKTQPPVLAYTSTPFRGLDILIEVFPKIRAAVPGTTLKVFSSLKVYQVSEAIDLTAYGSLYRKCRETEGVEYIGSISQNELARELRSATVLAYPNTFCETSCIAVMEAMASGCRIVTSELAGLRETTAGFARLVSVEDVRTFSTVHDWQFSLREDWKAYSRRFVEATVQVLRESKGIGAETLVRRMVDYANGYYTWEERSLEWLEWLSGICGKTSAGQVILTGRLEVAPRVKLECGEAPVIRVSPLSTQTKSAYADFGNDAKSSKFDMNLAPKSESAEDLNQMAEECYGQGKLEEAIALLHRSLLIQPDFAAGYKTLGNVLQAQSKIDAAIRAFSKAIELKPDFVEAHANLGSMYYKKGELDEAIASYHRAIYIKPDFAGAYWNLGKVLEAAGRLDEAIAYQQKALEIKPEMVGAEVHLNIGNTLAQQERLDAAVASYHRALNLSPNYALAHANLGLIFQKQGKLESAVSSYKKAIAIQPDFADAHFSLGNVLSEQGKLDEAVSSYQNAIAINPNFVDAYCRLGNTLATKSKRDEALLAYQKGLQIKPDSAEIYHSLGKLLASQYKYEEAIAAYGRSLQIKPNDGIRIKLATLLPAIYRNIDELHAKRKQILDRVAHLLQEQLKIDPLHEIGTTNFLLAYQGLNDKDIQSQIAQLYQRILPEKIVPPDYLVSKDKIRIGFISSYFYEHSVSLSFARLIQQMPRDIFHVTLFAGHFSKTDSITEKLMAAASDYIKLPFNLDAARKIVAQKALDILVYTDIGIEPFTYFLAFTRLAPVQCVLAGHPVTTGIPTMDYFISSELMEIESAQEHYSETLVRLKGLPVDYELPEVPEHPLSRSALGLPESRNLYVCPMMLFKVHPEFDKAIAEILRRDPNGEVVLFKHKSTGLHEQLMTRFRETMPDVANRVRFLPWASPQDFINILMQADAVLDTFHFSGLNTALINLAVGTPMVTWASPYMRGRFCYGLYRKMGVMDCVASSQNEYVDIACRIATNPEYRAKIKTKILQNNAFLYYNSEVVEEMVRFFISICQTRVER